MRVPRWQLKLQAKQTLGHNSKSLFVIGGVLVVLMMLVFLIQALFGGLMAYMPLNLEQFPMQTGMWHADAGLMGDLLTLRGLTNLVGSGGMIFALRIEEMGRVIILLLPWSLLISFLTVQLVVLLILSPFRMGALEQLWAMTTGQVQKPGRVFHWYADLRLIFKALAVQLALSLVRLVSLLLLVLPALFISFSGTENLLLLMLGSALSLAGPLVSYYLYCLLLPTQYVLARDPGISLVRAFREGTALFQGQRGVLFSFRLSFLPWNLASAFLNNMPDAYVFPYEELSTILLINTLTPPQEPPQPL